MPRIEATQVAPNRYSPLLMVSVELPGKPPMEGPALIDSGADVTILPAEVVAIQGVGYKSLPLAPQESWGAGGRFETRTCNGRILWRRFQFCDRFLVAEPTKLPTALLGRGDFFATFGVKFNWHRNPPWIQIDFPQEKGAGAKGQAKRKFPGKTK